MNSAVVAEKDQHRGLVGPVVAEPLQLAGVVLELEVGEVVRALGRVCVLARTGGSEETHW